MEGADGEPPQLAAQQPFDAGAHLAGRLVGEGDGHHAVGLDVALANEVSDALGEHPRLARARAGQDEDRAVNGSHRLPLGRIEVSKDVGHGMAGMRVSVGDSDAGTAGNVASRESVGGDAMADDHVAAQHGVGRNLSALPH